MALPMNTGAEAVETAIKAARRWAYDVKGLLKTKQKLLLVTETSMAVRWQQFPYHQILNINVALDQCFQELNLIPYGDIEALKAAITPNTAAFLIEPIQGEAGIVIPPEGFMKAARELCKENNVLFIADEIQAGLGRTGKMFACEWEDVDPDMYILGKALGGGVFPISCVVANKEILRCI